MAGIPGRSGRKRDSEVVKVRVVLRLRRGKHDPLIEMVHQVPRARLGEAFMAVLEAGHMHTSHQIAAAITAQEVQLATQERAEINAGLAGLGSEWDE